MNQHKFNHGNNDESEVFPLQNESITNRILKNLEVNINPQESTSLPLPCQGSIPVNVLVNRGTTHIFYTTRMCQRFLDGTCRNGENCTFAHGSKDLREPPPNWQELVKDNRGGNWNDDQKIIHKMRICRKFYNGDQCPYGENCSFLHESPRKFRGEAALDNGRTRESSAISIQTMVDHGRSQTDAGQDSMTTTKTDCDAFKAPGKTNVWKAQMCGKWEATGHGLAEPVGRVHGDKRHNVGGLVAANTVSGPITKPLVAASAAYSPVLHQGLGHGFLKLAHKKLNRIYGDWVDDEDDLSSL